MKIQDRIKPPAQDTSGAIELFPARISGRTVTAEPMSPSGFVGGVYSPDEDKAYIPLGKSARARTIRMHEAAHAVWSREIKMETTDFAAQAVEDAWVHLIGLRQTHGAVLRDECTVAIQDIRAVAHGVRSNRYRIASSEQRAAALVSLLRSAAILRKGQRSTAVSIRALTTLRGTLEAVKMNHNRVDRILDALENRDYARAVKLARKEILALPERSISAPAPASSGTGSIKGRIEKAVSDGKSTSASRSDNSSVSPVSDRDKGTSEKEEEEEDTEHPLGDDEIDNDEKRGESKELDSSSTADPDPDFSSDSDNDDDDDDDEGAGSSEVPSSDPDPVDDIPDELPLDTSAVEFYRSQQIEAGATKALHKEDAAERIAAALSDAEDIRVIKIDRTELSKLVGKKLQQKTLVPNLYLHLLNPNVPRKVKGRGAALPQPVTFGTKIRTSRLAIASASPWSQHRLFERKKSGGTVLIDASGSMGLNDKSLYDIAVDVPMGTVAYYSSTSDAAAPPYGLFDKWCGHLVVYAQKGRVRAPRPAEALPFRFGGNLIDYHAIAWLLKQRAPRYLVFDGGFTGPLWLRRQGQALLDKAVMKKQIVRVWNLEELREVLKIKKTGR
jgi:hypothetical protein